MARIEVPMPQMGESIAEGTVSRWLKQIGDLVERDEPILEISTDKVDAEIPAPQSGRLVEVVFQEGATVEVGTTLAYIDTDVSASSPEPQGDPVASSDSESSLAAADSTSSPLIPTPTSDSHADEGSDFLSESEDGAPSRITPVVRRMAEEHGINLSLLEGKGSGHGGRITKQDLLDYLEQEHAVPPTTAPASSASLVTGALASSPERRVSAPLSELWRAFFGEVRHPEFPVREGDSVEPMDKIRRLTAEHMVMAKRIAPHVHSFIEIDFTRIDHLRKVNSPKWREQGARVSFTAFVVWAVSRVLREYPILNSVASGDSVVTRGRVNIGIAVDLDPGLIVPVIRDADHLSLIGIGNRITDLADRARARKLNPDEVQGATFSITNPGVLGTLVGLPIIPKGTAAILGTGSIEKRVVVLTDSVTGEDTMAIRKRSIFSLGYDHRIVDGADAARFLARLRSVMEEFPDDA